MVGTHQMQHYPAYPINENFYDSEAMEAEQQREAERREEDYRMMQRAWTIRYANTGGILRGEDEYVEVQINGPTIIHEKERPYSRFLI